MQELGASRTDGVDACVPCLVVRGVAGGNAAAVDDGDRQAGARERDGERDAYQTGADDHHVALRAACVFPPNVAARRSPQGASALGRPCGTHPSVSMTWFWLV